jgi:hypothetical protein
MLRIFATFKSLANCKIEDKARLLNICLFSTSIFEQQRLQPYLKSPSIFEHDPEKWKPVFGKDHAQTRS